MIEIYQIKYFLAIVETGSFTKAAARACVTQPTLSAGIKKLEGSLGTILFDRSGKRVFLTESGSRFVDRAKAIFHQINLAETEIKASHTPKLLKLGILMTIPSKSIQRLLQPFIREETGVEVEIYEGKEQEILNRLDEGHIDIALSILRPTIKQKMIPLFEETYSLALASHHPLADKKIIHPSELEGQGAIIRSHCEILSESSRFFTDNNIRPRLVYRTAQDERALQMVAAGIGFTTMPSHYELKGVKRITLKGFDFKREIGLIQAGHHLRKEKKALLQRFADFTTEHVAYMTYAGTENS